jgi:hypothetical protein
MRRNAGIVGKTKAVANLVLLVSATGGGTAAITAQAI